MSRVVDAERVSECEKVNPDNTVGLLADLYNEIDHEMLISIPRLRRALIEFDEEVGADQAELTVVKKPDREFDEFGVLALQDPNGHETVLVAGRFREDGDQA